MKEFLKDSVKDVKFSNNLNNHPVGLVSSGEVSLEMEKIINQMGQGEGNVKAETTLLINEKHDVANKIRELAEAGNNEELEKYTKVLYNTARLVSGLDVENPSELTDIICNLLAK